MMVWIVMADDGNSQEAEIDVDSVWATEAEAHARKQAVHARRAWVEGRRIGETCVAYV